MEKDGQAMKAHLTSVASPSRLCNSYLRRALSPFILLSSSVILLTAAFFAASLQAQVSFDRLLRADAEPQNWLMYSGTFKGHRYSELKQITPENVRNLEPQWVFQVRSLEKFEATPLVVDGVLYTVQPPNDIVALDAQTG